MSQYYERTIPEISFQREQGKRVRAWFLQGVAHQERTISSFCRQQRLTAGPRQITEIPPGGTNNNFIIIFGKKSEKFVSKEKKVIFCSAEGAYFIMRL